MRTGPSTGFHTIAVVAGLAAVTGILAFLVLRPSWSRGALSASSIAKRPGTGSPILEAEFTVIRAALRSFIARLPSDRGA
jgi:hypothetical protein